MNYKKHLEFTQGHARSIFKNSQYIQFSIRNKTNQIGHNVPYIRDGSPSSEHQSLWGPLGAPPRVGPEGFKRSPSHLTKFESESNKVKPHCDRGSSPLETPVMG